MSKPIKTLTTVPELLHAGLINHEDANAIEDVADQYAIAIPHSIAARIDKFDPNDPLARQFIPSPDELTRREHERDDPIGDTLKSPTPGIVHRYPDRALLKLVSVCPVYCRFCFRRESVGPNPNIAHDDTSAGILGDQHLNAALVYVKNHKEIWELIITGGDPLILSPRRIRALNDQLAELPHLKIIRWHTRMPVILPQKITPELCASLKCNGKTVYIGLHTNHPAELTHDAKQACARLINAGHSMVSQTVLLKGINDDAVIMIRLMRSLVEMQIKPYYLHHTDLAPGTSHFRVSIKTGQKIMRTMRQQLSGIAQPTYVLDIPGAHGKVPIGPSYILEEPNDRRTDTYTLKSPAGSKHTYKDQK